MIWPTFVSYSFSCVIFLDCYLFLHFRPCFEAHCFCSCFFLDLRLGDSKLIYWEFSKEVPNSDWSSDAYQYMGMFLLSQWYTFPFSTQKFWIKKYIGFNSSKVYGYFRYWNQHFICLFFFMDFFYLIFCLKKLIHLVFFFWFLFRIFLFSFRRWVGSDVGQP